MVTIWWIASILLVAQIVSGGQISPRGQTPSVSCTVKRQRKPWQGLTSAEKSKYINATLCLINTPSKINTSVTKTRWDDFQYAHAFNMPYVHGVGAFLPFHRYFITVHEHVLRDECDYEGPMPYWDEPLDVENFTSSPIFDPNTGFGGNGSSSGLYVVDGPFANLTLHLASNLTSSNYNLTRNFNPCSFKTAAQKHVDDCMLLQTFEQARSCLENGPHASGHSGVGGLMLDVSLSPGDPIFWLHHTYLDKLWWQWQSLNLSSRLTDISGPNIDPFMGAGLPNLGSNPASLLDLSCFNGFNFTPNSTGAVNFPKPMPLNQGLVDYFNDSGNLTTLNHVLNSAEIASNATIRDVMDIRGDFVCAEYL